MKCNDWEKAENINVRENVNVAAVYKAGGY